MINFTVVIQACNFFIVYTLLRVLLFKPAVKVLYKERSFAQNLQLSIDATSVLIEQHDQEQEDKLYQFKQKSASSIPDAQCRDMFILKDIAPQLQIEELNVAQIKSLEHELSQSIIKKIGHVYE
ncbi:MAG: hypothetical protein P4L31_08090 [Candidatus Babeliales bacterium]|nr:hypothetical protein [Candidatus Babeliales bacterium]